MKGQSRKAKGERPKIGQRFAALAVLSTFYFLLSPSAAAALTLITRETFQGVGTINSGAPGSSFTTVTGTWNKRAVGPRVTGDTTAQSRGWSARLDDSVTSSALIDLTAAPGSSARAKGFFMAWIYVDSVSSAGNNAVVLKLRYGSGFRVINLQVTQANLTWSSDTIAPYSGTFEALTFDKWVCLAVEWAQISGNNHSVRVLRRYVDESVFTVLQESLNFNVGGLMKDVGVYNEPTGGTTRFAGRSGMASLYSTAAYGDGTSPTDVVLPPTTGTAWAVNTSTGSDMGTGLSDDPWLSLTKINEELTNCGVLPATSYAAGDSLTIDTSGAALVIGATPLSITKRGLTVQAASGQTWINIQAYKTISAGSWSTTGTTNVYSTADADTSAVVWEDDKWLNHPTGANFAAVSASLSSTAGSFWTDGTTMYVHPFSNTDPRSDGKVYTRSYYRAGASAINITVADTHLRDLYLGKTCVADKATNDPATNYAVQGQSSFGGTTLIEHCYLYYFSKHGIGMTDGNSNSTVTISSVQAEQGSPYSSQTPFVSYNAGSAATGNVHAYVNCTTLADTGLVGSTSGTSGASGAFYSHAGGGSDQFTLVSFEGCNFNAGAIGGTNSITTITVNNSIVGGVGIGARYQTVTRTKWLRQVPNYNRSDGSLTVRNCLITPTLVLNDTSGALGGTITIEGNTYDLSAVTKQGGFTEPGVLTRAATSTLTFRNNAVLFPPTALGNELSLFKNFTSTDTLTATNNAVLLNGQTWSTSYNDGSTTADRTFAQWQALGKDAGSLNSSNLLTDSTYKPLRGSPLVKAGVDLGPLTDYNGLKTFSPRDTIGAVQFSGSPVFVRRGGRTLLAGFQ